jgi:hypothetical protein
MASAAGSSVHGDMADPGTPRRPDASQRRLVVPALLAGAGILAIASGLLKWASISFPRTGSSTDTEFVGADTVAWIAGLYLLARAYVTLRGTEGRARAWGGLALVSGAFLIGYAIYDLVTLRTRVLDSLIANTADSAGLTVAQVRAIVESQVAEGVVRFGFRSGIYLALVAGCMALVGGLLSLTTSLSWTPDTRPAAEDPAPPAEDRRNGLSGVEPDSAVVPDANGGTPTDPGSKAD